MVLCFLVRAVNTSESILVGVDGFVGDWQHVCVLRVFCGLACPASQDDSTGGYEVGYDAAPGTHIWEHLALIYWLLVVTLVVGVLLVSM